jgi:hypothetical protein
MARSSWGKRGWTEQNRTVQEHREVVAKVEELAEAMIDRAVLVTAAQDLCTDDPDGENMAWAEDHVCEEPIICPVCMGDAGLLGTLGEVNHYCCRMCGWHFSSEGRDER